jgi:hypothetical protein
MRVISTAGKITQLDVWRRGKLGKIARQLRKNARSLTNHVLECLQFKEDNLS